MASDHDSGPTDLTGEPLRNTAVVEAMAAVAADDRPAARALLFQLLLESTLLVATPSVEGTGHRTTQAGDQLAIITASNDDGDVVLPVFTSPDALLRWLPDGSPYAAMPAQALFEMAVGGPTAQVVLDPGSPTWGIITRSELDALAHSRLPITPAGTTVVAGVHTEVMAEPAHVRVGRPADPPPPGLLADLAAAMAADGRITHGYVFLSQQGELTPERMVGVAVGPEVSDGDAQLAVQRLIETIGPRHPDAADLRYLVLDDGLHRSLADGAGLAVYPD